MIIKEFLPNPVGSDKEGEYIKLLNDGEAVVFLNGWAVKDAAGKTHQLNGSLSAEQELILLYSQTKIFLNNNGEEISLYNPAGNLIDKLNYSGQAEEGKIIERLATSELTTSEFKDGQLNNIQNSWPQFLFITFLTGLVLALLGRYIVLQLEKKLDIKLF